MSKPKTVHINAKCADLCFTSVYDAQGSCLFEHDGYVPGFMPEEHFGDYVQLEIDVETGKILNWTATAKEIESWIGEKRNEV